MYDDYDSLVAVQLGYFSGIVLGLLDTYFGRARAASTTEQRSGIDGCIPSMTKFKELIKAPLIEIIAIYAQARVLRIYTHFLVVNKAAPISSSSNNIKKRSSVKLIQLYRAKSLNLKANGAAFEYQQARSL